MTRTTILCLHGLGASKSSFDPLRDTALGRAHDIVALDFPGHGARAHDAVPAAPVAAAAADIAADLRRHDRRVVLVGHSMGGAVAILAAELAPDRVAGLVSIEGNLIAEDCGLVSRRLAEAPDAAACDALKHDLVAGAARSKNPAALLAWSRDLVAVSDTGRLLQSFRQAPCPTLYLHGDGYLGHVLLPRLPPVPVVHIPGAGHNVMADAPAATAAAIAAHILAP
jgi:pimeloyl-ACP methyl ester carboxylesterase